MPIPDLTDTPLAALVRLDGRVAVVTGGALGIGRAICRRLAEGGATVVVADLDDAKARDTATALADAGYRCEAATVDVRDGTAVHALADAVAAQHSQINIWVNNAGIYPNVPFLEMTSADWDRVAETNVRSAFEGSQAAARHMVAAGNGGVIIDLSSINGYRAFGAGLTHYTTSKHALLGLTKSLAVELGPHNIRVLALAPTMIETEGVQALRTSVDDADFSASLAAMGDAHPLGRIGVPDDIARVALFCASDLAGMMSGSSVVVDGGYLAM